MQMRDAMTELREQLRYEPTEKRIRATLGRETVVDTTRALLVWEPRRIVPTYAVPQPAEAQPHSGVPEFLHPGIPFGVHTTAGRPVSVQAGGETRAGAGFL